MAASKKWKPGDVVRLASGGPKMTVGETHGQKVPGDAVQCKWFDGNHELKEGYIHPDALVKAEDDKSAVDDSPANLST
jgi:uncharacterized protein YodC (DUF2158 family)